MKGAELRKRFPYLYRFGELWTVDGHKVGWASIREEAEQCGLKWKTVKDRYHKGDCTRALLFRPPSLRSRGAEAREARKHREVDDAIAALDARKREMGAV